MDLDIGNSKFCDLLTSFNPNRWNYEKQNVKMRINGDNIHVMNTK